MLFRDMVQTASRFTQALRHGLRAASLEEHVTEGNLFVRMNKQHFTSQGIDYRSLEISRGPVAPVAFTEATVGDDNVLRTRFEKNPLRLRADGEDGVRVFAFCPALGEGRLSTAAPRRSKRLEMALPDAWAGLEVVFYGFVTDFRLQASETLPIEVEGARQDEENETTRGYDAGGTPALQKVFAGGTPARPKVFAGETPALPKVFAGGTPALQGGKP